METAWATQKRSLTYPAYRRCFGLVLGTVASFAFSLVSQGLNHLLLPGIPLYQPPFGALLNILIITLVGAILGLILAWFEAGAVGILWSSLFGALLASIGTLLTGRTGESPFWNQVVAVILIFLPVTGFLAALLIPFRWAVNREENHFRETRNLFTFLPPRRSALPSILVLIMGIAGLTFLYNDLARAVTQRMNLLVRQGQQAKTAQDLPGPLKPPDVGLFAERGQGPYTLEWNRDEKNQYAIPRPAGSSSEQSTVIARFTNGYLLACMFPGKTSEPTCRDFDTYEGNLWAQITNQSTRKH